MENTISKWSSASSLWRTYLPQELLVYADTLDQAIEQTRISIRTSRGPSNGRRGNSNVFAESNTKISHLLKDEVTQTAAMVITAEVAVVGGMTGYEGIYVIKRQDNGWFVYNIECYQIDSDGPYVRLLLTSLENKKLSYSVSKENPRNPVHSIL